MAWLVLIGLHICRFVRVNDCSYKTSDPWRKWLFKQIFFMASLLFYYLLDRHIIYEITSKKHAFSVYSIFDDISLHWEEGRLKILIYNDIESINFIYKNKLRHDNWIFRANKLFHSILHTSKPIFPYIIHVYTVLSVIIADCNWMAQLVKIWGTILDLGL